MVVFREGDLELEIVKEKLWGKRMTLLIKTVGVGQTNPPPKTAKYLMGVQVSKLLQRQTFNLYRSMKLKGINLIRASPQEMGFFLHTRSIRQNIHSVTLVPYEEGKSFVRENWRGAGVCFASLRPSSSISSSSSHSSLIESPRTPSPPSPPPSPPSLLPPSPPPSFHPSSPSYLPSSYVTSLPVSPEAACVHSPPQQPLPAQHPLFTSPKPPSPETLRALVNSFHSLKTISPTSLCPSPPPACSDPLFALPPTKQRLLPILPGPHHLPTPTSFPHAPTPTRVSPPPPSPPPPPSLPSTLPPLPPFQPTPAPESINSEEREAIHSLIFLSKGIGAF